VFATPRALALSYVEPYVDDTGAVTAYAVIDLPALMGRYDWRFSARNLWQVEQKLIDYPHRPIATSAQRIERLRARYRAYRSEHQGRKPIDYYSRRDRWTPVPAEATLPWPGYRPGGDP
jgi:hypothetical protein